MGTASAASGAVEEGMAQQNYYNYLAAQNEAQIPKVKEAANMNVGLVSESSSREESNLDRDVSVVRGEQRAAASAGGVYGGSKTSEDIDRDTQNKAALDRAAIRHNADLQSRKIGYEAENEISGLRGQASSFRMAADNARRAGNRNAITNVLNGSTNVASRWYQWRQVKG